MTLRTFNEFYSSCKQLGDLEKIVMPQDMYDEFVSRFSMLLPYPPIRLTGDGVKYRSCFIEPGDVDLPEPHYRSKEHANS